VCKPAVDKIKPVLKDMSELTREELEEVVGLTVTLIHLNHENQGLMDIKSSICCGSISVK
jgi:hypothetical protein